MTLQTTWQDLAHGASVAGRLMIRASHQSSHDGTVKTTKAGAEERVDSHGVLLMIDNA